MSVSEPDLGTKKPKLPGDDHGSSDVVTIEYCTAPRPTASLRGSPEEFEQHALKLKAFLEGKFPMLRVKLQSPPSTHVSSKELHLRFAESHVYVPMHWQERRMPSPSEGRRRFPRINAFEVKANGRIVFSKLAGGPAQEFAE